MKMEKTQEKHPGPSQTDGLPRVSAKMGYTHAFKRHINKDHRLEPVKSTALEVGSLQKEIMHL